MKIGQGVSLFERVKIFWGRAVTGLGLAKVEENPYEILPENPLKLLGKSLKKSQKGPEIYVVIDEKLPENLDEIYEKIPKEKWKIWP